MERDGRTLVEIGARLATRRGLRSSRQSIPERLGVLGSAGLVGTRRGGRYEFHRFDTSPLRRIVDRWPIPGPEETR